MNIVSSNSGGMEEDDTKLGREELMRSKLRSRFIGKRIHFSESSEVLNFLEGLKRVQNLSESYLERYKVLKSLQDVFEMSNCLTENDDDTSKKKKKKYLSKLKTIEHLNKDFKDRKDVQVHQVELLLEATINTHIHIHLDKESATLGQRSNDCVKETLEKLLVDNYIPTRVVRNIFRIIQAKHYWQNEDCSNLIIRVCEKCKSQSSCLLFVMETMHTDYEYLADSAEVLRTLLLLFKPSDYVEIVQLVERCCQLIAECDPKKIEEKSAIQGCLIALSNNSENLVLPSLAQQIVRVSIGPFRSDIADLFYDLCKEREICGFISLIGPLILMLDDRDPDVVIRGYQVFTQILSPPIACLYQIHSTDNFLSHADKISSENQVVCPVKTLEEIKNAIKQIILSMLICYIRHAIYPKTLEALLIFNCTIIIEVKDPLLLSRLTSFLLNLQEAALSILPLKSMRQSFMQWAVTHLFLLVADVYSISSLKDYVYEVINQRKALAPFLLSPIAPSNLDSIPYSCLMEKLHVNSIIENWSELVEPTRTLRENTASSNLSFLSAWGDFDSQL